MKCTVPARAKKGLEVEKCLGCGRRRASCTRREWFCPACRFPEFIRPIEWLRMSVREAKDDAERERLVEEYLDR